MRVLTWSTGKSMLSDPAISSIFGSGAAGMFCRLPCRFKALDMSTDSLLWSMVNAAWMASPSMVNSDSMLKPFSSASSSSKDLPVNTFVSRCAIWSFTMALSAAWSIT